MYLSTKQVAEEWNISDRRVRLLCNEGKIDGAFKDGRNWKIPYDAKKPMDNRLKKFSFSDEFKDTFTRIENKKQQLNKMRPLTEGEVERLREEFAIEYTYNSNAIEGNTLTLNETEAIIKDNVTIGGKPLKDHLEVIGHKEAFDYVVQIASENKPFSEKSIKLIHSLVLADKPQDKGVYRRLPVRIMGSVHTPPQPYKVPIMMEQLILDYKDMLQTHTIERVALFHLKFESIHPFIDGNGRCGRLLLNFDLIKNGYPNIDIKFTDRQEYYACFNEYHETGTHSKMTNLIANYTEEMLDRYLYILK
jgi:Fic family protein